MYTLWIVSEDASLPAALAFHLRPLGEVWTGAPDAGQFKDADAPDLVVVAASPAGESLEALERLLGFLRGVPRARRAPAPVLYLEPASGRPPTPLLRALVDDRPLLVLPWPLDPQQLAAQATQLLYGPETPPSLRERARREWVGHSVERLYAGLELPALRKAIDPRNASRAVLLVGEPGTRRGLLARYIHNLAEPPRDTFITLPASSLQAGEVEAVVLGRSAGRRATVFLPHLERAEPALQEEIAQLLADSGAIGIEPVRWIASTLRTATLTSGLRAWTWLQVDLPALRERPDLMELAQALAGSWCKANERWISLGDEALEALARYVWPENLRELEAVLDASLADAPDGELEASALRFVPGGEAATPAALEPEPSARPARFETRPPRVQADAPASIGSHAGTVSDAETASDSDASTVPEPPRSGSTVRDLVVPLANEIREPLRAIRAYASLLEQRPDDEHLRRQLSELVEGDLSRVEQTLQRLERFATLGAPRPEPVDLAALVGAELDQRQPEMRARGLVVLRELEPTPAPAIVDPEQLRFAIGALLDRALRMVPEGGDLYVGSSYQPAEGDTPPGHRLLLRFHSPEDVLVSPEDSPGPATPIDVVLARELIDRMGGASAVDTSGSQDNVILIELPA